jgi:hypothetical protein
MAFRSNTLPNAPRWSTAEKRDSSTPDVGHGNNDGRRLDRCFANGKVIEERDSFDELGLLRQIGTPAAASV